jgi:hypothetical protein
MLSPLWGRADLRPSKENLASSDRGLVMFRRLLE